MLSMLLGIRRRKNRGDTTRRNEIRPVNVTPMKFLLFERRGKVIEYSDHFEHYLNS